ADPVEAAKSVGEAQPADHAIPIDPWAIGEPEPVHDAGRVDAAATTPPADRPPAELRAAIAYWHAKDPTLKPSDIAAKVGRSRTTVRRILADLADAASGEHAGPGVDGNPTTL